MNPRAEQACETAAVAQAIERARGGAVASGSEGRAASACVH